MAARRGGGGYPTGIMLQAGDVAEFADFKYKAASMNEMLLLASIRQQEITEEMAKLVLNDKELLRKLINNEAEAMTAVRMKLTHIKRLSDIGLLAATVAHELRNPLAAIQLAVFNIKKKIKEGVLFERSLETIEKKVSQSDKIISDLLSYSKLRAPHLEPVDLHALVLECITEAQTYRNNVSFGGTDSLKGISVEADPLQMQEVLTNLIHNAMDAVSDKKGNIEIYGGTDTKDIVLSFKDNGTGISQEDLENVFRPFFSTKPRGTGLGLAVCLQIVKMHGGSITIESDAGKGTMVTVRLPKHQHG
jgi:signal transduction histidine kinase